MGRSLRSRLILLLALLIVAGVAAGSLMVSLFRQSTSARAGEAAAVIGRACDAIGAAYTFYMAGSTGSPAPIDDQLRHALSTVVLTALRDRPGVEGGVWQADAGPLAYAFPTYEGTGPKTDLPAAELPRIRSINEQAVADDQLRTNRYDARGQALLFAACPLPGPIPGLSGWAMTRVQTLAGSGYQQLMIGLGVLLASVLAAAALSFRLTMTWSRHVAGIESALDAHDLAELPTLPLTNERELDRVVSALNEAGRRLATSRARSEELLRRVAAGERMAAIGRVAAGVAHEIRNPIAAMRLKAENALAGPPERKNQALAVIVQQVDRLDRLLEQLLTVTQRHEPRPSRVRLATFVADCLTTHAELATAKAVTLESEVGVAEATFDPEPMRRAVENLLLNAIQVAPEGSLVRVGADRAAEKLVLWVEDRGKGPPAALADHLFEPFVTGRADGTGLGLSIVREIAEAHGGTVGFRRSEASTRFVIEVPWRPS